jgi:flagellar secretion chaperone FliS
MDMKSPSAGLRSYQDVGTVGAVTDAKPYAVIDTMLETAITRVMQAKGHMSRGEVTAKGEQLGKALGLLEGLTLSLDVEQGGQIAENLALLYEYMSRTLVRANLHDDPALLDEVAELLRQLKTGWEGIPVELRS